MYTHPPITEAVIGINFTDALSEEDSSTLRAKLSEHYPYHQPLQQFSLSFEIKAGNAQNNTANTQVHAVPSHRLATADFSELVVLHPRAFVFSQMAPYPGWDVFFDRFQRDWKIVRRALGFRQIARLGVRYINRIDIPTANNLVEHEDFLILHPTVPNKFGPLHAYGMQAEIFMDDLKCKLLLNSGAVPSPLLNTASFLIDQDISRENDVPQRDEDILNLILQIRSRKNEVFESCVTDQARKLFRHVG